MVTWLPLVLILIGKTDFRRPEILLRSPSFALADSSPWEPTTVPLFNTLWRSPLVLVIFKYFNI